MSSKTLSRVAAAVAAFLSWSGLATASPSQYHYVGVHPRSAAPDGGVCYIEVPHVHAYAPAHVDALYAVRGDQHVFIGDPVAYGYDGRHHPYHGQHPIAVDAIVHADHDDDALCLIAGPHYHAFAPAPRLSFELRGGAYIYTGAPPPAPELPPPSAVAEVEHVYASIEYDRPRVDMRVIAPVVFVAAPVVAVEARTRHEVRAVRPVVHGEVRAGVEVHVPVPSLEVRVGGPVVVGGGGYVGHDHGHRGYKYKKAKRGRGHYKAKRGRYYQAKPRYRSGGRRRVERRRTVVRDHRRR